MSTLVLLIFSSAFDTIDHCIFIHCRHTDLVSTYLVFQCFPLYLTNREQCGSLSIYFSVLALVNSSVPQGSLLGPILISVFIKLLSSIITSHFITCYSLADHIELQMSTFLNKMPQYFTLCQGFSNF